MKIHADSLTALLHFVHSGRLSKSALENVYVTKDAKWLAAANGQSLALAAVFDAEACAGMTLSGLDMTQVSNAWKKEQDSLITIEEGLNERGLVVSHPLDDETYFVRTKNITPFPDPTYLIEGFPFASDYSFNIHGSVVKSAYLPAQLALVAKAMKGASIVYQFPRDVGTWFSWQKVGHVPGDFRVLVLGSKPAVWPKED